MIAGTLEIQLLANMARLQSDMAAARGSVEGAMSGVERAVSSAKNAMAALGLGAGIAQVAKLTDEWAKFTAQMRLASTSTSEYVQSLENVSRISKVAHADLASTGVLYARIANATAELGFSQGKVARITESVSLALKVSGATTQESASAMLQLSQAFASGTLRGEEFNAVNEAAPRLMKALAEGMGVPVGALKQLAGDGKITSEIMGNALPRALEELRVEALKVQTIGGAFVLLKNEMLTFVGTTSEASGVVKIISASVAFLSEHLAALAIIFGTVGAAKLTASLAAMAIEIATSIAASQALAASTLASATAQVEATATTAALTAARVTELRAAVLASEGNVALALTANGLIPAQARAAAAAVAHTAALEAQVVAAAGASGAMRAASGVMSFLGGPIGVVVALLGVAAVAWSYFGKSAADASAMAKDAIQKDTADVLASLEKQNQKLRDRIALSKGGYSVDIKAENPAVDALATAYKQINVLKAKSTDLTLAEQKEMQSLVQTAGKLKQGLSDTPLLKGEVQSIGARDKLLEWMDKFATKGEKMGAEMQKAKKELGDAFTPEIAQRIRDHYKEVDSGSKKAEAAVKKEVSAYESMSAALNAKLAESKLEAKAGTDASDAQKLAIKLDADLASGKLKLSVAHKTAISALIEQIDASDKARAKAIAEEQAYQEFARARYESSSKLVNAAVEEADKNESLAKTFGMTKAAIEELEIARLQEQLTSLQGVNQTTAEIAKLEQLIEAKKRNRDSVGKLDTLEASAKAAKQAEDDWKKASESINASLTDALMRGFESGKDFATNMRDTIVDAFKTMVLRPVISAIMSPVSNGINSLMGAGTNAASGAGGFGNLSSLGGAAYQAITGASAGASMASLAAGNIAGMAGGDALGAMIAANGSWAGVSVAATAMEGAAVASAASSVAIGAAAVETGAAAAATTGALAAIGPVGWAALAAVAVLSMADHGKPTSNTGSTSRAFDAAGNVTGSESYYGGTSSGADAMIVKMQDAYMQGAKSLGIATVASNFNFSGNTGKNGESPNFALGGGAGGKIFQQTEIKLDDAAVALAASRAVFSALQGSTLPTYLAGVFDNLSAGTATQEQITAALAGAQALVTWHTALTALPFDTLTNASYSTMQGLIGAAGGLDKLSGNLAGFYANFYSLDEKTAALTANTSKAFADLGLVMPAIDASTRSAYRSMIEELGAKDLSVAANAKAYTGALALQGAINDLAPAASAAKSSIKDLAKEMTGFDAAGLGKMILDAAFNPQAGMTAAESFAQALQYSVQNALISSTVGQISDTLYTSIIMPIVAGNAVAQGAMDAVVADATAKLDALGQLFKSDAFKSAIGSIATTVAGIMPSLTPLQQYTAPVAYTAPTAAATVDTSAADAAKAASDTAKTAAEALAASLKALGDTSASLAIELLRAQGQQAQADAAQRAIDIAGYGAAEIAIYDYNASIRAQITAIGAAKTAAEALVVAENAATAAREAAVQKSFDVTSAGAKTALDALSRAVDADKKLVATAYESASKTAQTALDKITTSVGKLQALATSLKSALDGMRIIGSDGAYRQDAQSQIRAALETARAGGGLPIDGTLTSALATVAKPSEQLFGSFTAYALDFYRTANDISDLSALTSDALSADETTQLILQRQITALKAGFDAENARLDAIVTGATAQLNALNGINTSVLSVASALENFAASMGAATTAKAALAAQQARAAALAATPVFDSGTKADVVGQIQAAASAGGITQEMQLYQTATSSGYTAAQVDKSMGWAPGTSNAWAAEKGLPTFAIGTNFVPTDMTANIHAGERIIPAADNRALMQRLQSPSDNNAVLVAEIRALRAEVAGLRASSERGNESAQRTADTLSGRQGVPFLVQVAP